jgi:flagellar M-ring protein FliF
VASSVADLSPADVTVMNQQGVALNKQVMLNNEEADPYQRLEVKKQLENYFTNKLSRILDKVVGSGKAIVTTDISLNYDEVKVTKEDIIPLPNTKGQSVGAIYKQRITNQMESADKLSNFAEDQAQMPQTNASQEVEFANNRRIEHILSAPGAIHKISVAVVLPENTDSLMLLKVREVVAASAGINPGRGDQVIVHAISTYQSRTSQPEASQSSDQMPELPALEQPAHPTNAVAVPTTSKYMVYYWLVPVLAALFLLALLLKWRRPQLSNKLSQSERDKLLQEINHWATGKHDGP